MQVIIKLLLVCAVLFSCLRTKHLGLVLEEENKAKIKIGMKDTELVAALGTPSFTFEDDKGKKHITYYSATMQWRAFFKPKIKQQEIWDFTLDSKKNLIKTNFYTIEGTQVEGKGFKTQVKVPKKP